MSEPRDVPPPTPRDSEARLRAVFDTAVEGIVIIDARGNIDSMNPAAERMFGWQTGALIGRNVSVLMPEPFKAQHDGYLDNYLSTGQRRIIGIGREVFGQRQDGSLFPIDLSVGEFQVDGRRLFTGIIRDITERRRLQSEVLRITELAQQRIGHDLHDDLCQQLAGIEFLSQTLARRLRDAARPEADALEEIATLIRSAVEYTRDLAHGMSPIQPAPDGLQSALEELAIRTARHFQIQVDFRCPHPVLIDDHAVASHLYRVAQEAISNGIKHGRAQRIEIGLVANNERIHLAIRDNGRGLPRVLPKKSGMGLRIMQYRAGMIGATLIVQREPTGGTTVGCSVHRQHPTSSTPPRPVSHESPQTNSRRQRQAAVQGTRKKSGHPLRKAGPPGR
jgi:two-component system sensor kinase FixL